MCSSSLPKYPAAVSNNGEGDHDNDTVEDLNGEVELVQGGLFQLQIGQHNIAYPSTTPT